MKTDARTTTVRPEPANKLSAVEQRAVLDVCNRTAYAHLPPSQIVPLLDIWGQSKNSLLQLN